MTGAQLRRLREANGLSKRQFGMALGFSVKHDPNHVTKDGKIAISIGKKVDALERKSFVPEPLVHRINKMVAEGRLMAR